MDLNHPDKKGQTPLKYAIMEGHNILADYLRLKGAKLKMMSQSEEVELKFIRATNELYRGNRLTEFTLEELEELENSQLQILQKIKEKKNKFLKEEDEEKLKEKNEKIDDSSLQIESNQIEEEKNKGGEEQKKTEKKRGELESFKDQEWIENLEEISLSERRALKLKDYNLSSSEEEIEKFLAENWNCKLEKNKKLFGRFFKVRNSFGENEFEILRKSILQFSHLLFSWKKGFLVRGESDDTELILFEFQQNHSSSSSTKKEEESEENLFNHLIIFENTKHLESIKLFNLCVSAINEIVNQLSSIESTEIPCVECVKKVNNDPQKRFVSFSSEFHVFDSSHLEMACATHQKIIQCSKNSHKIETVEMSPDYALTIMKNSLIEDAKELKIGRRIGQGGFSHIFSGTHNSKQVAIKELILRKPMFFDFDTEMVRKQKQEEMDKAVLVVYRRLLDEVNILGKMDHPNILNIYAFCLNPFYILTPLFSNGDLYHLLHNTFSFPNLPEKFLIKCAMDIAKGMNYLHSLQPPVIHRDLKTPNVFVESLDPVSDVCAVVADLGASVSIYSDTKNDIVDITNPAWMCPEFIDQKPYDEHSDIFR